MAGKYSPAEFKTLQENAAAEAPTSRREPIGNSADFKRICELPSRPWDKFQTEDFVDAVTATLKTTKGIMRLRPVQAAALIEAQRSENGIVALMGVGSGKLLVSLLLPIVMNSRVCVLLVPPALVEQTEREYKKMQFHWKLIGSCKFHIVSYSTLSGSVKGDILDRLKPDLIVADEASNLKNKGAARTKRVLRYLDTYPATRFCPLSGTMTTRSLKDCEHLFKRTLKQQSPIPHHYPVLMDWCQALDADIPVYLRKPEGVLQVFKETPFETARDGFRRRMVSVLGVVATDVNRIGTSLTFNSRPLKIPEKVQKAIDDLNEKWEFPSGEAFSDILTLSMAQRQLSCGFWYSWDWTFGGRRENLPDFEWLTARKNWNASVRRALSHAGAGMDSPLLLYNAAAAGKWKALTPEGEDAFLPWLKVKDRKPPPSVATWVDDFMVKDAVAWGKEAPGIIWYSHTAVGDAIAKMGGFPMYGAASGALKGAKSILDETGKRTVVVSQHAHAEGKNLQMFCRNLLTVFPSSGKIAEQLVGRTHRPGQLEDEVTVDMYLHTAISESSFAQAMADAIYIEGVTGNEQKLVYGTKAFENKTLPLSLPGLKKFEPEAHFLSGAVEESVL